MEIHEYPSSSEIDVENMLLVMRVKRYVIAFVTISVVFILGGLILGNCEPLPAAKTTIGVQAEDFTKPTKSAVEIMNRFIGCEFLVSGGGVKIKSTNGEPCGLAFHQSIRDGHSAAAYQCGESEWEIHIEKPGNLHTQVCIIGHELGHVAGLNDHEVRGLKGIMNQYDCPTPISLSGAEVDFLRNKFCF